jgi:hypothetical protein
VSIWYLLHRINYLPTGNDVHSFMMTAPPFPAASYRLLPVPYRPLSLHCIYTYLQSSISLHFSIIIFWVNFLLINVEWYENMVTLTEAEGKWGIWLHSRKLKKSEEYGYTHGSWRKVKEWLHSRKLKESEEYGYTHGSWRKVRNMVTLTEAEGKWGISDRGLLQRNVTVKTRK